MLESGKQKCLDQGVKGILFTQYPLLTGCASGVSTDEQLLLLMFHSFICILDFNISNMMQPLISGRGEMHAQYKMFPSESQFLLMQRGPTGHSVARAQIQTSDSTSSPSDWKGEVVWCFQTQPSVTMSSETWVTLGPGQWDAAAGSYEAICCGPQAATQQAKTFHREPPGLNPQTSHFILFLALLFTPKCLFACSFGTYGSAGEKGEVAPRAIRLMRAPKNKGLIVMSQLGASLAVSFRKSSSFMQGRKQMEITELI